MYKKKVIVYEGNCCFLDVALIASFFIFQRDVRLE